MSEQELQALIEQLSQQRSQKPGAHSFTGDPFGAVQGDLQRAQDPRQLEQMQKEFRAWQNTGGGITPPNPAAAPGFVRNIMWHGGYDPAAMNRPGGGYGGYTPEFASQIQKLLFAHVNPNVYGNGGPGTNEDPSLGRMGENALQNLIASEKTRMSPDNYTLSPEEEKTIEDALRQRYGR